MLWPAPGGCSKTIPLVLSYLSGIWSVFIEAPADLELLSSDLWELGTVGIEEAPTGLIAFFEDAMSPALLRRALPNINLHIAESLPTPLVQQELPHEPVFAGKRFVIVPVSFAEEQQRATPERIVLPIDAAMAFGSGRHETTQLCLEALERYLLGAETVFDVGCGSAILALAAQKLGASAVIGADIDEAAIAVARRHFNGPLFVGSADALPAGSADLVISNLTSQGNDRIAFDLLRIMKPGARLILSGFMASNRPKNFEAMEVFQKAEWECWICTPDSIHPPPTLTDLNAHSPQWWIEATTP